MLHGVSLSSHNDFDTPFEVQPTRGKQALSACEGLVVKEARSDSLGDEFVGRNLKFAGRRACVLRVRYILCGIRDQLVTLSEVPVSIAGSSARGSLALVKNLTIIPSNIYCLHLDV